MQTAALENPGSSTARGLTKHEALEYCKEDQKRFVTEKPPTRITVS